MLQPGGTRKIDGDTKVRKKTKNGQRRNKSGGIKVRVKLPPIESYEKDVEFRAEGPGRIIVRLERLMGSDRIRLTDATFMARLLEKLEEEENSAWVKRTKARKKDEQVRSRKLAIDGLMDPEEDMRDLFKHPVFRVNRVLKRLALFDQNMSVGQQINLPPIIPVEPFEIDGSGAVFKTYPRHAELKSEAPSEDNESRVDVSIANTDVAPTEITTQLIPTIIEDGPGFSEGEEEEEEEEDNEMGSTIVPSGISINDAAGANRSGSVKSVKSTRSATTTQKESLLVIPSSPGMSLTALQKNYGIPPAEDMNKWEGFRSDLVDTIYTDSNGGVLQLYQEAEEILGVYDRENLSVDEFVVKLNRMMGASGGA
ncbi:uncharacterized protein LOC110847381 [Folsomia candida]|uniref:Uncharacterized protein n=1 Tax=Folsomia candida TaxID=158441 RepID=A0A226EJG8_FOLCA|nr:uncharacterized protein LOC110847381 [Folsomia candida]XP_035705686.1 uncharacterized protein LOC110847381 [Folsomia candida]OXA57845.1 hypothetical protein Fcan01_07692 [Folsomia candida]